MHELWTFQLSKHFYHCLRTKEQGSTVLVVDIIDIVDNDIVDIDIVDNDVDIDIVDIDIDIENCDLVNMG